MKNKVVCGIKFILSPTIEQFEQLEEHCKRYRRLFNLLSKEVFLNYLQDNGKLINQIDGVGAGNATLRLRMILKDKYSSLFEKEQFITQTLRRNITYQVANRYRGYYKRNKSHPSRIMSMDEHKAITYNDMMIKYKDGNIIIPICGGKDGKDVKLTIKAIVPNCMKKHLSKLPKVFGGTLDKKSGKYIFIACVDTKWNSSYEPTDWIGCDIGKNTFLYFSDNINKSDKLVHNDEQVKVYNKIQDLLKKINSKDIKTNQRSLYRRQWINAHSKHKQILTKIAKPIIDYVQTNKVGLALDGAQFGATMGTSGQEITGVLKQLCVQKQIPFYVSNPRYTSQTCPKCGYIDKKNRNKEDFKCIKCNYTNHADKVGAINTKQQAVNWYNEQLVSSTP